jgi:hypothetical protein
MILREPGMLCEEKFEEVVDYFDTVYTTIRSGRSGKLSESGPPVPLEKKEGSQIHIRNRPWEL